jgi:hypothetical protein
MTEVFPCSVVSGRMKPTDINVTRWHGLVDFSTAQLFVMDEQMLINYDNMETTRFDRLIEVDWCLGPKIAWQRSTVTNGGRWQYRSCSVLSCDRTSNDLVAMMIGRDTSAARWPTEAVIDEWLHCRFTSANGMNNHRRKITNQRRTRFVRVLSRSVVTTMMDYCEGMSGWFVRRWSDEWFWHRIMNQKQPQRKASVVCRDWIFGWMICFGKDPKYWCRWCEWCCLIKHTEHWLWCVQRRSLWRYAHYVQEKMKHNTSNFNSQLCHFDAFNARQIGSLERYVDERSISAKQVLLIDNTVKI